MNALAFSPEDSKILASASQDDTVRVWNTGTGKQLHHFVAHGQAVISVAFAPDGKVLAAADELGVVHLWDVDSGKSLHKIKTERGELFHVAFSMNGKLLACCGAGGTISLWNPESGKEVRKWETGATNISCVALRRTARRSPRRPASAIRKWDIETGKAIDPLACHHGGIVSLQYAKDGKTLFSCGLDRRVFEWDLISREDSGRFCRDSLGQPGQVSWRGVDFTYEGKILRKSPG